MKPLPAVILAGGRATRMDGRDKTLLSLNGQPILAHILGRLATQAKPIAISANGNPTRFARFGLTVLPDPLPDYPGPLAGILAAMHWAENQGAPAVITVAGDSPFLPLNLVEYLQTAAGTSGLPALAAGRDGNGTIHLHPVFGLWPVTLRKTLQDSLREGQRKVRQWAAQKDHATAVFNANVKGTDPFFNINRPGDLIRAEQLGRVNT